MQKITPFLWFKDNAEEAVSFYISVFKNSKIITINRLPDEIPPQGKSMVISFELEGQKFTALNGGSMFTFNPAISFVVDCENQEEVDELWSKLSAVPEAEQCGWLQDAYGLSWQIIPRQLSELISDPDPVKAGRVTQAMLKMKKIDIAGLQAAYNQK